MKEQEQRYALVVKNERVEVTEEVYKNYYKLVERERYWDELLKKEDKLIENSDRKHRYHFKSLDSMSEELLFQESVLKYQEHKPEAVESEDFIETVKNEKLANALRQLTPKQRKAVELAYWQGYKHWEIAAAMGCKRNTVTELLGKSARKDQPVYG